ncbi:MAG: hypothetical protein ACW99Q_14450 [Candidatus Kariarchaeaceae archaeon]
MRDVPQQVWSYNQDDGAILSDAETIVRYTTLKAPQPLTPSGWGNI